MKVPFRTAVTALVLLSTGLSKAEPQEPAWTDAASSAARPNVVLILIDDLGWGDLGCTGHPHHRTPRIDGLAKEGTLFTAAYANAPNCAPSRAMLQTGRLAPRHGIYTVGKSQRGKAKNRRLVPTPNVTVLPDAEVTIAEALAPAGYVSAHVGKWHLGADPCTQGYARNVGGSTAGHPKSYFAPYRNAALTDGPDGEYLTTRLFDEAVAFIEERVADETRAPFFLHLAPYTVHTPIRAPEDRIMERREAGVTNPVYAAMVEALDREVGRLLDALDRLDLADDTLVLFLSDNGGYGPKTNREPLRGCKGTLDEGGIRVPWIVRWPGRARAGATSDVPISGVDVLPTLVELAGLEPATDVALDGASLAEFWQGGPAPARDALYWHFPAYLEGKSERFPRWRTTPGSAIRSGRWKLHEYFEDGHLELYDLEADPKEARDLAVSEPERAAMLARELVRWRASIGAPVPTEPNPKYVPQ